MRLIALAAVAALLASCGEGQQAKAHPGGASRAADAPEGFADQRKFRDWLVACDNIGTCHAFAPASEGTGWVRITMPGGPDAQPSVLVGVWPEGQTVRPIDTRIDEQSFVAIPIHALNEEDFPIASIAPRQARTVIDAMSTGATMAIVVGPETVPISLTGAAASLLWIDEHQGRLDTVTALIRKGSRPAAAVPAAPALPRVVAAPPVGQAGYGDQEGQHLPASIEALPAVVQCRADTAFNPDLQTVISSARLDANTVLWSVPCGAGAYNFINAYFTTTPQGTNPRRVLFPSPGDAEPQDLVVNAAYDPATRVLDAFNKGRGLGDCGMADSWVWTTGGFVLKSSSAMSECWGVPSEYWPAAWVSE